MMDNKIPPSNYYFRINERQNTFDSLQKTRVFLSKINEDEFYWKWAMLALHNAIYGSLILSLQGTNPDNVKAKYNTKDGEKKVIGFWEAFQRVQNPRYMNMYIGSKFVYATPDADKIKGEQRYNEKAGLFLPELITSLEHLNNYIRNQFLHYFPMAISFGKGGFVQIIKDSTGLIGFLLLESGNFGIDSDEERAFIRDELSAIENLAAGLKNLSTH